jgi:Xaa-Pro aminopeptidase
MIRKEPADDLAIKWSRMQQAMEQTGAGGCLLATGLNLFYATGLVYNGYFYLPAGGEPWFFVKRPDVEESDCIRRIRKPEQIPGILAEAGVSLPGKLLLETGEIPYNDCIRLQNTFRAEETGDATALLRTLRRLKTPWEIAQFRLSAEKHAAAYKEIPSCFRPGMTDLEFQYEIEWRMRRNGSLGVFHAFGANMDIFMGSVLAGANAETPSPFDFALGGGGMHPFTPVGANGTALEKGTAVMVDMAGNFTPYMTDMTRVYSVGKLPEEACRAHRVALGIQQEVARAARPGVACADLYQLSLAIAVKEGLADKFMGTRQQARFVGHGIGLQINEPPVLSPQSAEVLEASMVFALEPKFVIPGVGAVGIENSFLVTAKGVEKLTRFDEEIYELCI